jgi:hypothetical protein
MGTSQATIRSWLAEGKAKGATHMIVATDTFDHGDYPVYVMKGENARERADAIARQSMTRVMEVYSYGRDLEAQLGESRAFHYD